MTTATAATIALEPLCCPVRPWAWGDAVAVAVDVLVALPIPAFGLVIGAAIMATGASAIAAIVLAGSLSAASVASGSAIWGTMRVVERCAPGSLAIGWRASAPASPHDRPKYARGVRRRG